MDNIYQVDADVAQFTDVIHKLRYHSANPNLVLDYLILETCLKMPVTNLSIMDKAISLISIRSNYSCPKLKTMAIFIP